MGIIEREWLKALNLLKTLNINTLNFKMLKAIVSQKTSDNELGSQCNVASAYSRGLIWRDDWLRYGVTFSCSLVFVSDV